MASNSNLLGRPARRRRPAPPPGLTMSVNSEYWIGDVFGAAGFLILLGFIFGGMYFFVVQREKAYVLLGLEKEKTEALLRRIEKDLRQAATITISSPSTPTGWAWSGDPASLRPSARRASPWACSPARLSNPGLSASRRATPPSCSRTEFRRRGTGTGRIIPKKDFAIWSQAVETSRPQVSAGRSSRMSIPSPRPGSHATISPSWS